MADQSLEELQRQRDLLLAKKREKEEMLKRLQGIPPEAQFPAVGPAPPPPPQHPTPAPVYSLPEQPLPPPPPQRPVRSAGPPKKYTEPDVIDILPDKNQSKRTARKRKRASDDEVDEDFVYYSSRGGDEDEADDVLGSERLENGFEDDFGIEKQAMSRTSEPARPRKRQAATLRSSQGSTPYAAPTHAASSKPPASYVPSYSSKVSSTGAPPPTHPSEDGGRLKRSTRSAAAPPPHPYAPPQNVGPAPNHHANMSQNPLRGPVPPVNAGLGVQVDMTELRQTLAQHQKMLMDLDFRISAFETNVFQRLDRMQRSLDVLMHQIGAERDPSLQMHQAPPPPHHPGPYAHDGNSFHQGGVNVLDDYPDEYDLIK